MTIRKKIFIPAGILLALFGLVVGALAFVQKLNNDQSATLSLTSCLCLDWLRILTSTPIGTNWSFCERCVKILPTR